jgi:hypothetical protein
MYTNGRILTSSGVYCVENIINRRRYIGGSTNVGDRKKYWSSRLPKGTSENCHIQDDFKIYGPHSFVFYPICYCARKEILDKEQYYIDFYKTLDPQYGYNIKMADKANPLPEEVRKNMSLAGKGKILSKEWIRKIVAKTSIKVAQYDLNFNLIKIYKSGAEAAKQNNLSQGNLSAACSSNNRTCKGYYWRRLKKDV